MTTTETECLAGPECHCNAWFLAGRRSRDAEVVRLQANLDEMTAIRDSHLRRDPRGPYTLAEWQCEELIAAVRELMTPGRHTGPCYERVDAALARLDAQAAGAGEPGPVCNCNGRWTNGYREGQHVEDRTGDHSRYCARHGGAEYLARLAAGAVEQEL